MAAMGSQVGASVLVLSRETLRRCVIAGAEKVIAHREQLNAINVFPVPDRDTGTNLAATMRAVVAGLRKPLPSVDAVGKTLAASALAGAQGNSGVILAQFFQGLREGIGDSVQVTVDRFAAAMKHAANRARQALAQPREGTILTVMSDVAEHLSASCKGRVHDFRSLLDEGLRAARQSLSETPQRLAALRHAGVVDAGALGFVHFLEGIREHLAQEPAHDEPAEPLEISVPAELEAAALEEPVDFRYCTEAVLRGPALDRSRVLDLLSSFGDSAVAAGTEETLHVHVHTNVPALATEALADLGALSSTKVDDMWRNLAATGAATCRSGTALVTDSVCDLPIAYTTARRIHVVPLRVTLDEVPYADGIDITPRRFYDWLTSTSTPPKTSQPGPAEFETLYRLLARRFASIVSVHVSSGVSGTADSARRAARQVSDETGARIDVIDSRSASAGEACVVWAAARALEAGLDAAGASRVAQAAAEGVSVHVYVPTVRYFVLGGRLSPLRGRIARVLRLLPTLTMADGRVVPSGKTFGRRAAERRAVRLALRQARHSADPLFVVSHSEAPDLAARYEAELRRVFPTSEVLLAHAGPALGSHSGPGGAVIATLDRARVERAIAEVLAA